MIWTNVTTILALGLGIFLMKWWVMGKRPTLYKSINLFLTGGLLYGGVSAIYFTFTGNFLLNDTAESLKLTTAIGGLASLWIGYDIITREFKQNVKKLLLYCFATVSFISAAYSFYLDNNWLGALGIFVGILLIGASSEHEKK
jgi:hypothetical protein